jgi:hypothetical protein
MDVNHHPPQKELRTYVELSIGTRALAFKTVDRKKGMGQSNDNKLY